MKRILHLTNHLYGGAGAERQLMLNVKALDRRRFENYLCCVQTPRDLGEEAARLGIPVFGLGASGKPQWPQAVMRLSKLLRSLKIDLIHTSLFDADVIGGVAGRLNGVPVVSTLCNVTGEREQLIDNPNINPFKFAVSTRMWGSVLRFCGAHYIANSGAVKTSSLKAYHLPEKKFSVIYRSLDDTWFNDQFHGSAECLRSSLGVEDAYPLLLNVGRVVPQKGQVYLIQAMPKVLEQFPKAKLLIAGDSLHDEFKQWLISRSEEAGVAEQVIFLGRRSDIKELHRASDIFVFPSLFEGCPNALIEAMAMGKPCVASRIGPNEEIIENDVTGLLVKLRDHEAMAESITKLASQKDLGTGIGQRAREAVQQRFAIEHNIKQLEEVYERVAA